MKSEHILGIIVVIIILAIGAFLFARQADAPIPGDEVGEEMVEELMDDVVEKVMDGTTNEPRKYGEPYAQPTESQPTTPSGDPMPNPDMYQIVTYTDEGFSPLELQIASGDTVFFWNRSSDYMWVSGDLPSCDGAEKGMTFDSCGYIAAKNGWTYTFTEAGTFEFKDNLDQEHEGRIVVF